MYSILFDLDTNILQEIYGNTSWNNAYAEIRRVLEDSNFTWQQGSVYFGNEKTQAIHCVLAVQKLNKTFPWFATSVRDIRMLRIEEINDLKPVLTGKIQK